MKPEPTLRTSPEYPESALPPHVKKLTRPEPLQAATQLAFLRFEKTDLLAAERFWSDFGLITVSRSKTELVMRCANNSPAVLTARKGTQSRFLGAAFAIPHSSDVARLQREFGATPLQPQQIPGGGVGVSLKDPDGNEIWLLTEWSTVDALPQRTPLHYQMNTLDKAPRVNATIRSPIEPATVGRLGHFVLQTSQFKAMTTWYMRVLGIIPTDVQYLEADGEPMLTFFRLNLGDTPADHHTVVIASGLEPKYEHSAWEVIDLDALGQGQQVLRANGHEHMWGIGRHVLGSQLFDYWKDADGFEFEHYTDGDVFTASHETHYVPFSTGSIWAWGDDAPASMFPRKSLSMLLKAIKLIRSGQMTLNKLKLLGAAIDTPARPWL